MIPISKISASLLCLELSSKPLELVCKVVCPCTDYNYVTISTCLIMTVIFKDGEIKRMCALETTKYNNDILLIFHYLFYYSVSSEQREKVLDTHVSQSPWELGLCFHN